MDLHIHTTGVKFSNFHLYSGVLVSDLAQQGFLTQEQIDALINEHFTKNPVFHKDGPSCKHDWKEYVGFTSKDFFCTKCNIKRKDDETK